MVHWSDSVWNVSGHLEDQTGIFSNKLSSSPIWGPWSKKIEGDIFFIQNHTSMLKRATRCTKAPAYAGSGKGSHHFWCIVKFLIKEWDRICNLNDTFQLCHSYYFIYTLLLDKNQSAFVRYLKMLSSTTCYSIILGDSNYSWWFSLLSCKQPVYQFLTANSNSKQPLALDFISYVAVIRMQHIIFH